MTTEDDVPLPGEFVEDISNTPLKYLNQLT